jgi:hypothetical protein
MAQKVSKSDVPTALLGFSVLFWPNQPTTNDHLVVSSRTSRAMQEDDDEEEEGGSDTPLCDPALHDAREEARTAYRRYISNATIASERFGRPAPRVVNAGNLSTYWSGDDQYAAERSRPFLYKSALNEDDILVIYEAAASRTFASPREEDEDPPELRSELRGVAHDVAYSESHVALYLHKGNHFAAGWPELAAKIVNGMRSQDGPLFASGVSPTRRLNVRCVELHTYVVGGALSHPGHKDNGSKLTMSVQLSPSDAFDGGQFVTWREGECVAHVLNRGDGLLFQSEKCHNVSTVTRGVSQSLVIELWVAPPNAIDRFG